MSSGYLKRHLTANQNKIPRFWDFDRQGLCCTTHSVLDFFAGLQNCSTTEAQWKYTATLLLHTIRRSQCKVCVIHSYQNSTPLSTKHRSNNFKMPSLGSAKCAGESRRTYYFGKSLIACYFMCLYRSIKNFFKHEKDGAQNRDARPGPTIKLCRACTDANASINTQVDGCTCALLLCYLNRLFTTKCHLWMQLVKARFLSVLYRTKTHH